MEYEKKKVKKNNKINDLIEKRKKKTITRGWIHVCSEYCDQTVHLRARVHVLFCDRSVDLTQYVQDIGVTSHCY